MATYSPAKRATAWVGYISLVSQASTLVMQSNPTIAAGDFKVSKDGGALANLTTLPAVTPASSKMVKIDLSATEMTADNVTVVCSDAAGAEWCDLVFNLQPSARQIDDLAYPATSGRSMVVDASGLVDANAVKIGPTGAGTAQTARDIGASVLLSSGTGTGQIKIASGYVAMTWADIAAPTTAVALTGTTIATSQVVASVTAAVTLTSGERNSVADALLDRDMSTGTDSGSTTVRTTRQALRALRNKSAVSAGTLTIYKEDDSTSSWTAAVTGTAGADPITAIDPAGP